MRIYYKYKAVLDIAVGYFAFVLGILIIIFQVLVKSLYKRALERLIGRTAVFEKA